MRVLSPEEKPYTLCRSVFLIRIIKYIKYYSDFL